jgi:hypothetical protein
LLSDRTNTTQTYIMLCISPQAHTPPSPVHDIGSHTFAS